MKRDKIHDFYFHKAKKEKYSARSVYKLQNIQEKYHLFSPGNTVLDLGAAPGSWSEYLSPILGPKGKLFSLDQNELSSHAHQKIENSKVQFQFLKQSIFDPIAVDLPVLDAVISDMAPATQGNRTVDCSRSLALIERAFELAEAHLKRGGHFVVKLFHSDETIAAAKSWEKRFKLGKLYRPPAVQKDSKEIYFVGQHFIKEKAE